MDLISEVLREHSKAQALVIGHSIYNDTALLEEALNLLLSKQEHIANRIAYAITQAHDLELKKHTNKFDPFYPFLIDHLEEFEHQGIRRNICRMLSGCEIQTLKELDLGTLADVAIIWLYDSNKSIATKVHCMTILLKICRIESGFVVEVKEAMTECTRRFPSKGILAKSKHMQAALEKI
jgi:hypothetical protein